MNARHRYAAALHRDGFWATAPGTPERAGEEQIARAAGLDLIELKPLEAELLGHQDHAAPGGERA